MQTAVSYQLLVISYQLKALAYGHATRMATLREQLSAISLCATCCIPIPYSLFPIPCSLFPLL
ncbi:hypothetical protein [Moorena producens]|uniref:hypothetical protein n=1 Tax=Moorena producens TaxID=1155739 RepID=UPI0011EA666B|nr:hypothetical protein [Moorena producens]